MTLSAQFKKSRNIVYHLNVQSALYSRTFLTSHVALAKLLDLFNLNNTFVPTTYKASGWTFVDDSDMPLGRRACWAVQNLQEFWKLRAYLGGQTSKWFGLVEVYGACRGVWGAKVVRELLIDYSYHKEAGATNLEPG